jgi:outer membrane protein OmpA-like peptidoglycan-associated protein
VDVSVQPDRFSPDGDGRDDILSFGVRIEEIGEIAYWYLEILDPRDRFFYDDGGSGEPPAAIRWNGIARNGERVVSAERYRWRIEIADTLSNTTTVEGTFQTDVLVERTERGYRIQIPGIQFEPNSARLVAGNNEMVLDRVAEILQRFPEYAIQVEGQGVNVTGTSEEGTRELQPLWLARAETVRDALVTRGISPRRLEPVGRGGTEPIVPHTDLDNRWKNRRVDFLLIR